MSRSKIFDSSDAIDSRNRMARAQKKELTPTMLEFHHDEFQIDVNEDSHGWMSCSVTARSRLNQGPDLTIRFLKRHGKGVLWTFNSASHLRYLAFEPDHSGLNRQ